jgi:hypothetical protein
MWNPLAKTALADHNHQRSYPMNLTNDQIQALDHGDAVPVLVDGRECVVLRRDIFDRVKGVIEYDEMSPEEAYPAVLAAWDQEEDPGLDAYQDYKSP